MCRRTIRAAQQGMPDAPAAGDERAAAATGLRIAEIDGTLAADIRRVIFGSDADPYPNLPHADTTTAGVLLELMKDLLYQTYVRPRRLRQSLQIRRFFSEERGALPTTGR